MTCPHLDDLTCPQCRHRGSFHIDVTATAYVDAAGPCVESDYYWDATSRCACLSCHFEAPTSEFVTDAKPKTNALDASPRRSAAHSVRAALATLVASCEEALDGRWDRSDDGFDDMITVAERAIALLDEVAP